MNNVIYYLYYVESYLAISVIVYCFIGRNDNINDLWPTYL